MISIMLLLLLPFAVGMVWSLLWEPGRRDWALIYLYGSLTELVTAGVIAMPAVKFRLSFYIYRILSLSAIGFLAVVGFVLLLRALKRGQEKWRVKVDKEKTNSPLWACAAVIFFLMASCYFLYVPEVGADMTAETIHTTVHSDTLFEFNPATGEPLALGIYPQAKLMALPLFYSIFYRPFGEGIPAALEMRSYLYRLIPIWVLLLNGIVFWKWGEELFLGQKKEKLRRSLFLCFYGVANLFGDYLFITFSYKLLHQAWLGETIFITVLLPFMALQIFTLIGADRVEPGSFRQQDREKAKTKAVKVPSWIPESLVTRLSALSKRSKERLLWTALCVLAGIFCAPWREVLVLSGMVALGGVITAVIWRKLYESNR